MKYATAFIFALACMLTAACGGGEYQAPPKGNDLKPHTGGTGGGGGTGGDTRPDPTGPSKTREFNDAASKAQDAWDTYARERNGTNYAICGAHIFNALRFRIEHERNGHDAGSLRGLRELNKLRTDWAKSEGQLSSEEKKIYNEHPDYVAAKKAYDEVQQ